MNVTFEKEVKAIGKANARRLSESEDGMFYKIILLKSDLEHASKLQKMT